MIEAGRSQVYGQPVQVFHHLFEHRLELHHSHPHRRRSVRLSFQQLKLDAQRGQGLANLIVQLAGDVAALALLDFDQPLGVLAQRSLGPAAFDLGE